MTAHGDLDRDRIHRLHTEELTRFRAERPGTIALQERARAHMPNGTPMAWMVSDNDQPVYVEHGQGASFTAFDANGREFWQEIDTLVDMLDSVVGEQDADV